MDGIHDLGGRHGFGKIDVTEPEIQFHAPYEARVRSIVHAVTQAPDWSVDWFRHCRELIGPADYLTRPYFDQWAQTYSAMLINSGWATIEEIASGKAASSLEGLPPPITAEQARASVLKEKRFDAPIDARAIYNNADEVRTVTKVSSGHTRLPIYARGKIGRVIDHHGAHVFAEAMALTEKRHVHLYTVEFSLAELWPEVNETNDTVTLDLWESYLEPV